MDVFDSDMTLRWSCREGDYLIFARCQGLFASSGNEYTPADVWKLEDGNFITITNRKDDLPEGFYLHPLEVSGSLVKWMMAKVNNGYDPEEPATGPNIWRVFTGDRIVWVGPERQGVKSLEKAVLGLLEFKENALVYGEPLKYADGSIEFGGFNQEDTSVEGIELCKAGWDAIKRSGLPRTISADSQWRIG